MIDALKQVLIRDEGEVNYAYRDSEGYLTIGVGRLIDKNKGGGITHEESMFLLDNDIIKVIKQCEHEFNWFQALDDARQIVVLSMVFNLGIGGFKAFRKTITYIESENYEEAAIEMLNSRWSSQVGNRAARLSSMMRSGELTY